MSATPLEVNQQIINDWRDHARRGEDLTEEQLAAAVSFYRKARSAAPEAKRAKSTKKAEPVILDDSVMD